MSPTGYVEYIRAAPFEAVALQTPTGDSVSALAYMGTSPARIRNPLGPYSRRIRRALCWSQGGVAVSYERGTPVREC